MKKTLTALIMLIGTMSLLAQIVYFEGFEGSIPDSWTILDLDGNNEVNMSLHYNGNSFQAHEGNGSVKGGSSYNPDDTTEILPTNNWLISEQIFLDGNLNLELWMVSFFEAPNRHANANILLSTTTNTPDAFTETIAIVEDIPYDFNNQVGFIYTQFSFDLSAYNGEQVYIAIQNEWETNAENSILFGMDNFTLSEYPLIFPEITITNPESGDLLFVPDVLTITVETENTDYVEFYFNGSYIGTANEEPFSFDFIPDNSLLGGNYPIITQAYNENGMTQDAVEGIDFYNIVPECELTSPNYGYGGITTFIGEEIEITGTATDTLIVGRETFVRTVANMKFYVDDNLIETDYSEPFEAVWNSEGSAPGEHIISIIAEDDDGNLSEPDNCSVTLLERSLDEMMEWSDIYGGFGMNGGFSSVELSDGSFVSAGSTGNDSFIIKYDESGNVLWERTYSEVGEDYTFIFDVAESFDEFGNPNGLITTGDAGNYLWIMKTDIAGNSLWTQTYGLSTGTSSGRCVLPTDDGGFVLTGILDADLCVLKTDEFGEEEWLYSFYTNQRCCGTEIIISEDNNYLITGYEGRNYLFPASGSGGDITLIKLDENGNEIFNNIYGGDGVIDDVGLGLIETVNNDIIIVGNTTGDFVNNEAGGYLLRLDSNGEVLSSRVYGENEKTTIKSIVELPGDRFIFGGYYNFDDVERHYDFWIKEIDEDFNEIWDKTYGGFSYEVLESLSATSDGGVIFTGYTYTWGEWLSTVYTSHSSMFTAKLYPDETGIENDELVFNNAMFLQNYPNPFNPSTTISFSLSVEESKNAKLEIYNIRGQKVKTFNHSKLVEGSVVWNGKDDFGKQVSSGIYLYKLKADDFVQTKKMLMMK